MLVLYAILNHLKKSSLSGIMEQLPIIVAPALTIYAFWIVHPLALSMMAPCVIRAVNSQSLEFDGNVRNVSTMICAQFVIKVINIILDIDFIVLPHPEESVPCWNQDVNRRR